MTQAEFAQEYSKLESTYPNTYGSSIRKELIAKLVRDMPLKWFSAVVTRIILNPQARIDIEELVRSEKNAASANLRAKEAIGAIESLENKMSDEGFEKVLKMFKANSLAEAVKNAKEIK